jgi:uncharacterized membrane protein YeaQ/YmgE (transglycosylase-associated protein family)
MHLLSTILIGVLIGWMAGIVVHGKGLGLLADLIVGVLGAFLGGFIASKVGIQADGLLPSLCVAVLGAVILLLVIRIIKSD